MTLFDDADDDDDRPVLPDRPDDEYDVGWGRDVEGRNDGDDGDGGDDDATGRLLAERPPHHLDAAD